MNRILATLLFVPTLAGCAALFNPGAGTGAGAATAPVSRENQESRQVIELIGYIQKVAALRAEEQRRELNASNRMFSRDRGIYGRVRLALLLALPGTTFNDDTKAVSLLEPLAGATANETPPGPMQQFAGLLYAQINERLREQRRSAQLKEQLEALKEIERKIIEREQTRTK